MNERRLTNLVGAVLGVINLAGLVVILGYALVSAHDSLVTKLAVLAHM